MLSRSIGMPMHRRSGIPSGIPNDRQKKNYLLCIFQARPLQVPPNPYPTLQCHSSCLISTFVNIEIGEENYDSSSGEDTPRKSTASRKGINSKFASTSPAPRNGKRKAQIDDEASTSPISLATITVRMSATKKAKPTPTIQSCTGAVSVGLKKRKDKGAVAVRTTKHRGKEPLPVAHSMESILQNWSETTEYGIAFRAMTAEEKGEEIINVNKGATKAMKDLMKKKVLGKNYKDMVAQQMREHIKNSRSLQTDMFHAAPKTITAVSSNVRFLSVGEWVEVDADRTPGFNSEGGIAVIISVHDDLADVKYVITIP